MLALASLATLPVGHAATTSTVVGATVPSATTFDPSACTSGTPNVTHFGNVLPGSSTVTSADCSITFGSSNDTSMLRMYQRDEQGALRQMAWYQQTSGTGNSLQSISAVNAQVAYAVARGGTILKTVNAGVTWTSQASGVGTDLLSVSAVSANVAWASGMGGVILRTTDGGATWATLVTGTAANLYAITAVDASTAYVGGESGGVLRKSIDGGATWVALAPPVGGKNIYGLDSVGPSVLFVAGSAGLFLRSIDGGATWNAPTGVAAVALSDVTAISATNAWTVGSGGTIQVTTNGTSLTTQASGTTSLLNGVSAADATHLIAVGNGPTILRTSDGGTTWLPEVSSATFDLYSAAMPYGDVAWAIGNSGRIHHDQNPNVADYSNLGGAGDTDWSTGASMFGVCLRQVLNATTTWPTSATCPAVDGTYWSAPPATSAATTAKIAQTTTGVVTGSASFRFGFRAATNQPPGAYAAQVVFEVIAPAA